MNLACNHFKSYSFQLTSRPHFRRSKKRPRNFIIMNLNICKYIQNTCKLNTICRPVKYHSIGSPYSFRLELWPPAFPYWIWDHVGKCLFARWICRILWGSPIFKSGIRYATLLRRHSRCWYVCRAIASMSLLGQGFLANLFPRYRAFRRPWVLFQHWRYNTWWSQSGSAPLSFSHHKLTCSITGIDPGASSNIWSSVCPGVWL